MNRGILYFDLETSGLDPRRHGILQAGWIVEENGDVLVEERLDVRPFDDDDISLKALEVNKFTLERIARGTPIETVMNALKMDLYRCSSHPLRLCGYKVDFDVSFLMEAVRKTGDAGYRGMLYEYIDFRRSIDPLCVMRWMDYCGQLHLPDYKLESVCEYYNIDLKAHDALEDCRAIRKLIHLINPWRHY